MLVEYEAVVKFDGDGAMARAMAKSDASQGLLLNLIAQDAIEFITIKKPGESGRLIARVKIEIAKLASPSNGTGV